MDKNSRKYTDRMDKLRKERGWSVYQFGQESGIYAETIHKWFNGKTKPSMDMIEQACEALGLTPAELIADYDLVEMTPENMEFFDDLRALSAEDKASVRTIMKSLRAKKK